MPTPGNVVIGQSGGPTAVINQTLVGVVAAALRQPQVFRKVYGAIHGIQGIIDENFCDFALEDPATRWSSSGTSRASCWCGSSACWGMSTGSGGRASIWRR